MTERVELNLALAIAAGAILMLGLAAGYIRNRLWVSEPLIALLIGILVGPAVAGFAVLGIGEPRETMVLRELARITLSISVMGAAMRLPPSYETRNWRELVVILGLGMPLMWLASSAAAAAVLGVPLLVALAVGAALAPTDPVLSDSIVTGRIADQSIPPRMRNAISAEAGANDGLGVLLVFLPILLLERPWPQAIGHWVMEVLIEQVLVGVAVGFAIGWVANRCFRWVVRQPYSEQPSILPLAIALALAVLALDRLLGTAAILAVFVAGLALNRATAAHEEAWQEHMQAAVARYFDIPIFILIGAILPWSAWADLGWAGVAFALLVLFLRRIPAWFLIQPLLRSVNRPGETLFNGWFGPIGVAAIYYATELRETLALGDSAWAAVTLVVFGSIVLHGITATPLTRAFGRSREQSV